MSFPKYRAYKASGIAWLGNVPATWSVLPLKAVATCNDEVLPEGTDGDTAIEYVEISGVREGRGITQTESLTFAAAPSRARRVVRHGDVLISTVRTYLRAIATVLHPPENLVASTGFAAIRPRSAHPGFLGYLLHCEYLISEVISRSVGISYPAINASDLMRLKGPIPGREEQAAIALFLDRETAKIDALVEEQQRLVQMLKEKRQAVISQAVTKGLDASVPMKDSGVDWLGQVPAAWKVAPLKRLCALLKDGTHLPPARVADGVPLLSVRNIQRGIFSKLDDDSMISEESYEELCRSFVPQPTDVLLAIVGATLGKTAVVPDDIGRFHIQRSVAIFRPEGELTAAWLHLIFQSNGFQSLLWESAGFSAQPGVYLGTLAEVRVAVPPPNFQAEIMRTVSRNIQSLDELVAEAEKGLILLGERRAALISAAVTGKIDVRGLAPQPEAVAA